MTKAQTKKLIQAEIDRLITAANSNIGGMYAQRANPQVAAMITKNEGYKLALEDVQQFLGNLRG